MLAARAATSASLFRTAGGRIAADRARAREQLGPPQTATPVPPPPGPRRHSPAPALALGALAPQPLRRSTVRRRSAGRHLQLYRLTVNPPLVNDHVKKADNFIDELVDLVIVDVSVLRAVRSLAHVALRTVGSCFFVASCQDGFEEVARRGARFLPCDADSRFPEGFMTQQLKGRDVDDDFFFNQVQSFGDPTMQLDDRWPPGHLAANLPKDGGYLHDIRSGMCLHAAIRFEGLPVAPFAWDGVGTKHTAALHFAWCLRKHPHVVIVGSESGSLHGIVAHPTREQVEILRYERYVKILHCEPLQLDSMELSI